MPFTGDDGIRSPDLEYSGARVLRSCASAYDDTTGDIFEDDDSEDVESETSRAVTGRVRPRAHFVSRLRRRRRFMRRFHPLTQAFPVLFSFVRVGCS